MTKYAAVLFAAVLLLAGRGVADELPLGALTGRRGALDPAELRVTEVIPVGACEGLDIGVGASAPIAVEVVTPEGARITSDTAEALGAKLLEWDYDDAQGRHVWRVWIDHAPAGGITSGEYQIEITATESLPEPAGYALSWNGKGCSREVIGTLALGEDHVFLGKSVAIVAMLFEGEVPLPGATVEAAVILNGDAGRNVAGRLTLKDDGSGYDLKAGDGDYTGVFTPSIEGQYDVVATASGADSDGKPFERTFLAMFSASDGSIARLNGTYSYEKDLDEGGRVSFSYVDPALRYPAATFSGGVLAVCEARILATAAAGETSTGAGQSTRGPGRRRTEPGTTTAERGAQVVPQERPGRGWRNHRADGRLRRVVRERRDASPAVGGAAADRGRGPRRRRAGRRDS